MKIELVKKHGQTFIKEIPTAANIALDVKQFPTIVQEYNNSPDDITTLTTLASATTFSVIKKCVDPTAHNKTDTDKTADSGYNSVMVKLKNEVHRDRVMLSEFNNAVSGVSYHIEYNQKGDAIKVCDTPDLEKVINRLAHDETIGDGADLIHDAIVEILEQKARQQVDSPDSPIDMEKPYKIRRLKKRVHIKKIDSKGGYETVETKPIIECFRAVRRSVAQHRTVQTDPASGYVYLNGLMTDPDGDNNDEIYIRLPKFSDMGGYVKNFCGQDTVYTADDAALDIIDDMDNMIEKMGLTDKQMTMIELRLRGYGYKAIATYLGIRPDSVRDAFKAIQKKALKIGFKPTPEKSPEKSPEKTRPQKHTPKSKFIFIALLENFLIRNTFYIPTPSITSKAVHYGTFSHSIIKHDKMSDYDIYKFNNMVN